MGCFSSKDAQKGTVRPAQAALDDRYPAVGTGIYSNQQKAAVVNSIDSNPYEEAPKKPARESLPQYPPPAGVYQHDPAMQYPPPAGAYPAPRMANRRRRRPLGPGAGLLGGGAGGLGLGLLLANGGGGFGGGCGGGGGGCGGGGC